VQERHPLTLGSTLFIPLCEFLCHNVAKKRQEKNLHRVQVEAPNGPKNSFRENNLLVEGEWVAGWRMNFFFVMNE
jgi:hypothetical protein